MGPGYSRGMSDVAARRARVLAGLDALSMEQVELARRLKTTKQYLGRILNGDRSGDTYWMDIARHLRCDPMWLKTGRGVAPEWATAELNAPTQALRVVETGKPASREMTMARLDAVEQAAARQASEIQALRMQVSVLSTLIERLAGPAPAPTAAQSPGQG